MLLGVMDMRSRLAEAPGPGEGSVASSFEAFYRQHYPPAVRLAQSVLGDFHAAQDVAQEVFLAAHQRFRGDVERPPAG